MRRAPPLPRTSPRLRGLSSYRGAPGGCSRGDSEEGIGHPESSPRPPSRSTPALPCLPSSDAALSRAHTSRAFRASAGQRLAVVLPGDPEAAYVAGVSRCPQGCTTMARMPRLLSLSADTLLHGPSALCRLLSPRARRSLLRSPGGHELPSVLTADRVAVTRWLWVPLLPCQGP